MLALTIYVAPFAHEGEFKWIVGPDDADPGLSNATWYCDGSLLDGKWKPLRATGFGIALVTVEGDLLAYGLGWPPSWCATAAAAEVWALQIVLEHSVEAQSYENSTPSFAKTV